LNDLDLNEPKGNYFIYSTPSIYRSVAMILFHRNGMLGREKTGGVTLFAHDDAMAVDRLRLKPALQWMNFNDVSSYRIVERLGSHLRRFYGTGGDGLGWWRWRSPSSGRSP
jgi:hypothetical protein